MEKINKENGAAIGMTVLIENEPVNFKLALITRKGFGYTQKQYAFVADGYPFMALSVYSGGITGFGINETEIYNTNDPECPYKVISTDLKEISRIVEEDRIAAAKNEKQILEKKKQAVKKLNNMPDGVPLMVTSSYLFIARKGTASFDQKNSKEVNITVDIVRKDKETGDETFIGNVDEFFRKGSGKISRSRSKQTGNLVFGKDFDAMLKPHREIIKLNDAFKEYKLKIITIKSGRY